MNGSSSGQNSSQLQARATHVINQLFETAYMEVSPDLTILLVSPNLPSMLAEADASMIGRPLTSVCVEFAGAEDRLAEVLRGEIPSYQIERVHHHGLDGEIRYLTFHAFSVNTQSPSDGLFLVVEDASRYGNLEQSLVQKRNELRLAQEALLHANADLDRRVEERTRELVLAREHLLQQNERLRALRNIDLTALGSSDMQLALGVVAQEAQIQLRVDTVIVMLYHARLHYLETGATQGLHAAAKFKLHLGEGVMGRVALDRRPSMFYDQQTGLKNTASIKETLEKMQSFFAAPLISHGELLGVIGVGNMLPFTPDQEWLEFFENLAGQAAMAVDNIRSFENLQRSNIELMLAYETTIEGWSRAISLRDQETQKHTERMVDLTLRLAQMAGVSGEELIHIKRGVLLHDIGKIAIPDAILLKPDALSLEELDVMRKHPSYAYEMLQSIAYLHPALDIPYCHHERWDGTGYPRGLKGNQIPLAARLFAIVDVWDALRSDRPYRSRWPDEKIIEYIRSQSGKHFDPKVVEMFLVLQAHMTQ